MTERSEGIGKHSASGHVADEGGLTTARREGPGGHRTLVMGSTKEVS
jgi:hypothetical protein